MPDIVDAETRSRIMSRVRSKNTRPEIKLRQAMWRAGLRGWRCHSRSVVGTPDLCWKGRKVAVFVDSAWWHGHESRWTPGRLPEHWDRKIEANTERDARVTKALQDSGWVVVRIWDFELEGDLRSCVSRVFDALAAAQVNQTSIGSNASIANLTSPAAERSSSKSIRSSPSAP